MQYPPQLLVHSTVPKCFSLTTPLRSEEAVLQPLLQPTFNIRNLFRYTPKPTTTLPHLNSKSDLPRW
jgi:hypothetical protein